jgi:hypothetical protein
VAKRSKKASRPAAAPKRKPAKAEKPAKAKKPAPTEKPAKAKKPAPAEKPAKAKKPAPARDALPAAVAQLLDGVAAALTDPALARSRVTELRDGLRRLDRPAALPRLLDLFGPGDPHELRSEILYALDRFPEGQYFAALLEALPRLIRRAPGWAFVALVRVVNTREGPESCASRFEKAVAAAGPRLRHLVSETLRRHRSAVDPDVAANIDRTLAALGT